MLPQTGHESKCKRARRRVQRFFQGNKDNEAADASTTTSERRDHFHPTGGGNPTAEDAGSSAPSESHDPENGQEVPSEIHDPPEPVASSHAVEVVEGNTSVMGQQLWLEAYKSVEGDPTFSPLLEAYRELLKTDQSQSQGGIDVAIHLTFILEMIITLQFSFLPDHPDHVEETTQLLWIQKTAQEKLDRLDSSRLAISIGNKRIVVREQVRKLVKVVVSFKDLIGAAVSAEPHAALAWAGVMVILPLLDNIFQQDEDAADGFEQISFLLIRFCHLQDQVLSPDSQQPTQSMSYRELVLAIQRKMIKLYSIVYRYQIRMVLQFARNKPHRIVRDMVVADDWKTMLKDIVTIKEETGDAIHDLSFEQLRRKIDEADSAFKNRIKDVTDLQETTLATVKDLRRSTLLSQLPYSNNAVFDSQAMSRQRKCLEGTQIKALTAIQSWAEDPDASLIFWLQGMAGTGKSSIALTVAECLSDGVSLAPGGRLATYTHLGASFFLSHDDPTRNDMTELLPTIARNLADRVPVLGEHITAAVSGNGTIGTKRLQEQMTNLMLRPLWDFTKDMSFLMHLVIVIDALDECIDSSGVGEMLRLLPELEPLRQAGLRILLTSRPESYISSALPTGLVHPFALEKIRPRSLGDQNPDDITIFMVHELDRITKDRKLKEDWVSKNDIDLLIKKADGLFIYAAITCRFFDVRIEDESRKTRVRMVLDGNTRTGTPEQLLSEIYLKVLSLLDVQLYDDEKEEIYSTYRSILGAIALVMEPVSITTLSQLIERPSESVGRQVEQLRSIINIPLDVDELAPLSFFHFSFQEYLLSERCEPRFRINQDNTQRALFARCLVVMNEKLVQDMCHVRLLGTLVSEIPKEKIRQHVPQHLRYSCLYWVSHLSKLDMDQRKLAGLEDNGAVHDFLVAKFLYWLETLSLIGEMPRSVSIIHQLQALIPKEALQLSRLLQDFSRFTLLHRHTIEQAPLQTYCSALIFSPMKSIVRETFGRMIPSWITQTPVVDEQWSPELLVLEGHESRVLCVTISPDGATVASGSWDTTTRLWDAKTGVEMLKFRDSSEVCNVAFSADGETVASWLMNGTITVRDVLTGQAKTLEGAKRESSIGRLAFSSTSDTLMAVSKSCSVQTWDLETGEQTSVKSPELEQGAAQVEMLAISADGRFVAAKSINRHHGHHSLWVWDVLTNDRQVFGKLCPFLVEFSSDGEKMASVDWKGPLVVWDVKTATPEKEINLGSDICSMIFSPVDGHTIAVGCFGSVKICDTGSSESVTVTKVLKGSAGQVEDLSFSASGNMLASISTDNTVRLWDPNMKSEPLEANEPSVSIITRIWLHPEDEDISLAYSSITKKISTMGAGKTKTQHGVRAVTLSPDRNLVVLSKKETVECWNFSLTDKIAAFDGVPNGVSFSQDGKLVALYPSLDRIGADRNISTRRPRAIQIFDTETWTSQGNFELDMDDYVSSVHYSPQNRFAGWVSLNLASTFHLYNFETRKSVTQLRFKDTTAMQRLHYLAEPHFTFSPDNRLVAVAGREDEDRYRISILQTDTGVPTCFLELPESESGPQMAFDAKGDHIATASQTSPLMIHVWEVPSGNKKRAIHVGGKQTPLNLEFSSTGQIMMLYRGHGASFSGLWEG